MSAEPSGSTEMRVPGWLNSLPTSPTIRSISPSNVTRPAVPPYSSITTAWCVRCRFISSSTSSAFSVSGTVNASRR